MVIRRRLESSLERLQSENHYFLEWVCSKLAFWILASVTPSCSKPPLAVLCTRLQQKQSILSKAGWCLSWPKKSLMRRTEYTLTCPESVFICVLRFLRLWSSLVLWYYMVLWVQLLAVHLEPYQMGAWEVGGWWDGLEVGGSRLKQMQLSVVHCSISSPMSPFSGLYI